jgi:hypothetical protein
MGAAEISLLVSGVAAVGSIAAVVITYRLGRERFDHERRLADLDAVRRVLDDATASMQRAHMKMAAVNMNLDAYGEGRSSKLTGPLVRADRLALETAYDDLAAHEARLEIRFGSEHELTVICRTIGAKVLEVVMRGHQIKESPDSAFEVDEQREPINRAVVEVGLAIQSFTLTAFRAVGVRLPAKELHEV